MKSELVPVDSIKTYPNNPRRGNVNLIKESLEAFGQYKPITVNLATNHILVGNHTYQAALELGWKEIAVTYVNVDEKTAAKIVLIDNRATDLGKYDNEALLELLETLNDLEHTGYTDDQFDDVLARIEEEKTPTFAENPMSDYSERFLQKATRMLMLEYPNEIYLWATDKLGKYRAERGLSSNAEAVLKLVETATNAKAPE
jgi:ParB-like nuclease domain